MKTVSIISLLICLGTAAYSQKYYYKPQYSTALDTVNGRKSLKQCSRSSPDNVSELFVATPVQLFLLEKNFRKVLNLVDTSFFLKKPKHPKWPKVKTLDSVLYQYTGVIIKGRSYIYISAISLDPDWQSSDSYKDWKTEAIRICDGGDSFWGVLFDLRAKSFSQLRFNGQ